MEVPSPAALLEEAADLIEIAGWVRNSYHEAGGYCAIGALNEVTYRYCRLKDSKTFRGSVSRVQWEGLTYLHGTLMGELGVADRGGPSATIVTWNDHQAADQYEVIDALRLASKRAQL